MTWTKQDLYTLLVGLAAAVLITLGEALVQAEQIFEDPATWATNLAVGVLAAIGRYILTEATQRGFTPRE